MCLYGDESKREVCVVWVSIYRASRDMIEYIASESRGFRYGQRDNVATNLWEKIQRLGRGLKEGGKGGVEG